jgi:peptidoglycan/LPS O-acetylase OafA/YrhL
LPARIHYIDNTRALASLLGILLYLPLSHLRTVMDSWFVGMVSEAILSWLFTLGVFHLVKRFLDWNNPTLAYMSEASYGVYLLHQPVIVMLASVFLAPLGSLPVWPAYALLLGSSLMLTYLSYHLLIKRSATGALLLTGLVRRRA